MRLLSLTIVTLLFVSMASAI
jgi:hypothetical protein